MVAFRGERPEGFPVRVRTYQYGRLAGENRLESIVGNALEAATFDVPNGFEVKNLADEIDKGR